MFVIGLLGVPAQDLLFGRNVAMGANSSNIGQAVANARSQLSNHDRKPPCGQPIDTVLDQESGCHVDNGKGTKNH
jgi:hypothetical protein